MKHDRFFILALFLVLLGVGFVSATVESVSLKDYIVDFEYDDEDVEEGETFRIEVTIQNDADEDRDDIKISLDLEDPFDAIGDDDKDIGFLADGASKTVSFRIEVDESVREDFYPIEFDVEDNVDSDSDEIDVEVNSNTADLVIGNIESSPSVISPDTEDIKLTMTIENIGDKDSEATRARLILPEGFTPSSSFSNIANMGVITSGENKEVVFFIDSNEILKSGNYEAKLEIDYENSGDSERVVLDFDLPVKGRPQFVIENVEFLPHELFPGSEGKVSVTILNIGEDEGMETSIRVFENSDQPFEFNEKTNFIGNVKKNQVGTGSINFLVDSGNVAGSYIVRMQTRTISEGNVLIEEHSFPVKISAAEGGSSLVMVLVIFPVILLVVLFFLYRRGRRI